MKLYYFESTNAEEHYLKNKLPATLSVQFVEEPLTSKNASHYEDADMISVFIDSIVDSEVFKKLPHLKFIIARSTGYDQIDIAVARQRAIRVSNCPTYATRSVAEFMFGLLLAVMRKLCLADCRSRSHNYERRGLQGHELQNKLLGVVGVGAIGKEVIKIAHGFGMGILAFDIKQNTELSALLNFSYVATLEELLSKVDIVTLHAPYTTYTHHMINEHTLGKMKKGSILINTARGMLVDNKAVQAALDNGLLAGVGMDVFEKNEDLDALLSHSFVIATPHIAYSTEESFYRMLDMTVESIEASLAGHPIYLVC